MPNCPKAKCAVYNESSAFVPLYYAYASYCESSSIDNWDCNWCQKASKRFIVANITEINSLQAFLGFDVDQNQIVISFRGTHNYENWLDGLEYEQIPYPQVEDAYVHRGFYESYKDISNNGLIQSLQAVLSAYPSSKNILIAGHSMGGALSELCALDLIQNRRINQDMTVQIYTFGAPRWANKYLAKYFDALPQISMNWRIVNRNDPIPIVPGKFLGYDGFYHTATEIFYYSHSDALKYRVCDGSGEEDAECEYSLWKGTENSHLWYLNEYENCGRDRYGKEAYHKSVSVGDPQSNNNEPDSSDSQYGNNLINPYNPHWVFSLSCICVGFFAAIIYYALLKCHQRRNGYKSIRKLEREEKERKQRKNQDLMRNALLE